MGKRLSVRKLKDMVGKEIGVSDWLVIIQEMINAFADCTEDRQWIHVDADRAARSPLGGTIAHGTLLLSLLARLNIRNEVFSSEFWMAVNYGFNRVRFLHPVRTGSRIRNRAVLKSIERRGFHQLLVTVDNTIEIERVEKPAMVAEALALIYL